MRKDFIGLKNDYFIIPHFTNLIKSGGDYYESSAAAVQALTDYNKNPYDLTSKDVTKQKGGLMPPHNH